MDIPGEETQMQARGPARAKSVKATMKKGTTNMDAEKMAERHMATRMPAIAPSHTAAMGKHVDGLAKMAQMGMETRMPDKAPSPMGMMGGDSSPKQMQMRGKRMDNRPQG